MVEAVSPAALRASPLAAPIVRAFLLFHDTYVAAASAGEAYEQACAGQGGGAAGAATLWAALRANLAAAHDRLLAAVLEPGWSFRPSASGGAAPFGAAATAALVAEAAALAAQPLAGVLSAAPRSPSAPYVWDAVVVVTVGATASAAWGCEEGGDDDTDGAAATVVLPVEVVAAADHPATAPFVRFAPASGVWHPNVSPVGGVPAVGAAVGAAAEEEAEAKLGAGGLGWVDGSAGPAAAAAAVGTVAGTLAAVARLLASPDPRWAVNAAAAAELRLAPAAFWARFRRGGAGGA